MKRVPRGLDLVTESEANSIKRHKAKLRKPFKYDLSYTTNPNFLSDCNQK